MKSKFEVGDKVIITGAHYASHKNHRGRVVEVITKKREVYPGYRKSYLVICNGTSALRCGAEIKPKADHMELEETLTDMVQ